MITSVAFLDGQSRGRSHLCADRGAKRRRGLHSSVSFAAHEYGFDSDSLFIVDQMTNRFSEHNNTNRRHAIYVLLTYPIVKAGDPELASFGDGLRQPEERNEATMADENWPPRAGLQTKAGDETCRSCGAKRSRRRSSSATVGGKLYLLIGPRFQPEVYLSCVASGCMDCVCFESPQIP